MRRWELDDALLTGYILVVAAVLVVSSACFGLGTLILLRGGLPAVVARPTAAQPGIIPLTDPGAIGAQPVLTATGEVIPFSTTGVGSTVGPPPMSSVIPFSTPTPGAGLPAASPTFIPAIVIEVTDAPTPTLAPEATVAGVLPARTQEPTGGVIILEVNEPEDWVRLKNTGSSSVDLTNWIVTSDNGFYACVLVGLTLAPGEEVRVWSLARDVQPGDATCDVDGEMWLNVAADPAILYDADFEEVDRYPRQ